MLATILVSNSLDLTNGNTSSVTALVANDGGDGISLREAVTATNNTLGDDSIRFSSSVFTGGDDNLIRLTQGQLMIRDGLSVNGTSVGGVTITGDANGDDVTVNGTHTTDVSASLGDPNSAADDLLDDNSRVLNFFGTGSLTLGGLTITGGRTTGRDFADGGGGIRFESSGTLHLFASTVSGNSTDGARARGGGIYTSNHTNRNSGVLSLSNSKISGNRTVGGYSVGGGIFSDSHDIVLISSTVSDNQRRR